VFIAAIADVVSPGSPVRAIGKFKEKKMRIIYLSLVVSIMVFGGSVANAQQAGQSVVLQYGTVEGVKTVQDDGKRAAGTAVGGLAGAAIAKDHRGLGMLAGGLIGGRVEKHHTAGTLDQYSVRLMTGATMVVNSDQNDLIVGDCVVVEQGQYTNVRRVSSINCHLDQKPEHHVSAANNCQLAKDELNSAKTDEEIEQAVIKVRTLCED
jgi:outer membrane lipoprotein SlyB